MQKLNSILTKLKDRFQNIPWESLKDLRVVGLLIFLVIVLLVSWSGVKSIKTNYDLQKQITSLHQQNGLQDLENNNQQLQNDYFNSNQYQELTARQLLGLGQPGETELIVPENVALASLANIPNPSSPSTKPNTHQPGYEHNFESWVDFFLHRQNNND